MSVDVREPRINADSSPPANRIAVTPSWKQPRVMVGAAIVTVSVVLGALLIGSADDRVTVWAARHDLSAGTTITQADIVAVPLNSDHGAAYIDAASQDLVGKQISRAVGAQELIALSSVVVSSTDSRLVTIPVEPAHAPQGLTRGERVDVYLSARDSSSAGASKLVLSSALVSEVSDDIDSARGEIAVVLEVGADQAAAVVTAARGGVIDLVRVPIGAR